MGYLIAQGVSLAIGLIIGLLCLAVGLFLGHIIIFDSIALGIAAGVCCNAFTNFHPAICLAIGIAIFLLLLWLQNTNVGFWIIGVVLTLFYACAFGFFGYIFSENDPVWGCVIFGLGFILIGMLHFCARDN